MRRVECVTRLGINARRQKIINAYHSNEIAVSRQQAHEGIKWRDHTGRAPFRPT
jgi:hypothetical protein